MTHDVLLNSPGWHALRDMLVHSLWQGPLLLALGLLGEALTRRRPQAAFALSCGLLLLMPVLAFATYRGAFTGLSRRVIDLSPGPIGFADTIEASTLSWSGWTNVAIVTTWAGVASLLMLKRLVAGWCWRKRLLHRSRDLDASWRQRLSALSARLGLKRSVRLVVSRDEDVPLTFGWLRPVVVVPEVMLSRATADQAELLLLHELVHLRRRDYPVMLVQHLVQCSFFYNPAVWGLSKLINQHRELACDRDVLSLGVDPRSYAAALVGLEGLRQQAPAISAAGGDLPWRVRAILDVDTTPSQRAPSRWAAAVGLATIGFAAVACSGGEPADTSDSAGALTVELFEGATTRVNGTPVHEDAEIGAQASQAGEDTRAFIRAHGNVELDRIIDVLGTLKRAGLTRVAFRRIGHDEAETDAVP